MKKFALYTLAGALLAATALVAPARAEVPSQFVNAQTGTTYTVVQTDCSKLVTFSNGSSIAVTLPQAATSGKFASGCFFDVENKGAGVVTITPTTSTINGATTLALPKNTGARIVSDGTNYQVELGGGIGQGVATCTSSSGGECDGIKGVVTTSSLTTVIRATSTVAFTNTLVGSTDVVLCTLGAYSGTIDTNGVPTITQCTPTSGVITARIANVGSTALSGTVAIQFAVIK